MNNNASFTRKIVYIVAIAILMLPLAALSQPSTEGAKGSAEGKSAGGTLSTLRVKYGLSQAELGEIDPASETMKLSCLGMRGIAANILWLNAIEYKKKEDFDSLERTVNQLKRIEPNFLKVWDFQAHNLAYNTSVEFDNYKHRYEWVKKGIRFLIEGTQYNRDEPGLLNQVGWFVGQKVGRADENKQFRAMFRDDTHFHQEFEEQGVRVREQAIGVDNKPDNWLASKLWYDKAIEAVSGGKPIRLKSSLHFYSGSPMALINGAEAMEKDGTFGQRAKTAWDTALAAWISYGNRDLMSSGGFTIRLNSREALDKEMKEVLAKMDSLEPGILERMRQEAIGKLSERFRAIHEKSAADRTPEEMETYVYQIIPMLLPRPDEVASRIKGDKRPLARELADRLNDLGQVMRMTVNYCGQVSFDDWLARCESEQTTEVLKARELIFEAEKEREKGANLTAARKNYEEAWGLWAVTLEKWPILTGNAEFRELVDTIKHYQELLNQLDAEFPADFPLNKFLSGRADGAALLKEVERYQDSTRSTNSAAEKPAEEVKPAGEKPVEVKPAVETEKPAEKAAEPKAEEAKPADGAKEEAK
ncbi:MAG: hypothetical protein ACO1RA_14025 [Planctomycetaceae bacterium]